MFYLDTDHKNIIHLFDDDEQRAAKMKKKQIFITMRYALMKFHFKIAHISGNKIPFADYLSRDGNTYNNMQFRLDDSKFYNNTEALNFLNTIDHINQIRQCVNLNQDNEITLKMTQNNKDMIFNNHKLFIQTDNIYKHQLYQIHTKDKYYDRSKLTQIRWAIQPIKTRHTPQQAIANAVYNPPKSILKKKNTSKTDKTYLKLVENTPHTPYEQDKLINYGLKLAAANAIKNMRMNQDHHKIHQIEDKINRNHEITANTLYDLTHIHNITNNKSPLYPLYNYTTKILSPRTRYKIAQEQYKHNKKHQINLVDEPNYHIDEQGRRRGQRTRKQTKSFYDDDIPNDNHSYNNKQKAAPIIESKKSTQNNSRNKINNHINDFFTQTIIKVLNPKQYESILNTNNIINEQNHDLICINIKSAIKYDTKNSIYFNKYFKFISNLIKNNAFTVQSDDLLCIKPDKTHPHTRVVIPVKLIKTVLDYSHKSLHRNHPGIQATQKQIERRYWWYKYASDIKRYINECNECQLGKGSKRYNIGKLVPLYATEHGEFVHFDFAGPFHNRLNILVVVDAYTGAVMFIATNDQTAATVIRCLIQQWMPIHGLPRVVITDRGAGFISELNQRISETLGIHKLFTSRYHPQTNGKAERMVRELKKQLRMLNLTLDNSLTDNKTQTQINLAVRQIKTLLPSIQFACNQRIRHFSNTSPHQLLYGHNLRSVEDIAVKIKELNKLRNKECKKSHLELIKDLTQHLTALRNNFNKDRDKYIIIMKRNHDKKKTINPLNKYKINDYVAYYVGDRSNTTRKLRQRFTGPWKIIDKINDNTYKLLNEDNNDTMCCHVQMLKKYSKDQFTPLIDYRRSEKEKMKLKNREQKIKTTANNHQKRKLNDKSNKSKNENENENEIIPEIANARNNKKESHNQTYRHHSPIYQHQATPNCNLNSPKFKQHKSRATLTPTSLHRRRENRNGNNTNENTKEKNKLHRKINIIEEIKKIITQYHSNKDSDTI